jgi:NADPH:quinone reductase-like Zn-dependent oxidoreductase
VSNSLIECQAILIEEHGGSEVLKIKSLPMNQSVPKGHVRIKVKATSLNHMDLWVRNGIPGLPELPLILGCDGAGEVMDVADDVTDFEPGDRVFFVPLYSCGTCEHCQNDFPNRCQKFQIPGEHVNGVHREIMDLPVKHVRHLDDKIDFQTAAAFPLTFMTAWHMIHERAKLQSGETILIIGGTSGVGSAAIQMAKNIGATVITTAGTDEKMKLARSFGADHVINHYDESISKRVKEITDRKGANVIFEHVGEAVWEECMKSLSWSGRLVTCGATSGPEIKMDLRHLFIKQQTLLGSTMGTYKELDQIHEQVALGKLKPHIGKTLPFTEVKKAHELLESGKITGKVVLTWE